MSLPCLTLELSLFKFIYVIFSLFFLFGCKKEKQLNAKPIVVATTTMLGDLSQAIGGDLIVASSIMSPGGDPHLYQPTPKDVKKIAKSDLIIVSGLNLEGWIDDLVRNASSSPNVIVASKGVTTIGMEGTYGVDPHFWFDLGEWRKAAKNVALAISKIVKEDEKMKIEENLKKYLFELEKLDKATKTKLLKIPKDQRILVTSHDAFAYFGRAYDIKVVAIQGMSTEQEASNRDLINVIEVIRKHRLRSVFVETSVNPSLIKQAAKETGVKLSGPLYSDSIGIASSKGNTFLNAFSENVNMIVEGLGDGN